MDEPCAGLMGLFGQEEFKPDRQSEMRIRESGPTASGEPGAVTGLPGDK